MLPLVVVLALVAIAVPTCRMVGCDMDMNAMPFVPFSGAHFASDCPGQWEMNSVPASTLPSSSDTILLTLVAALVVAFVAFAPQVSAQPVYARVSNPPPPPEEPRGERFRV